MEIIVEDTNILIDLFNTGLIRHCQSLGVEFHSTWYVVTEIDDKDQQSLLSGMIANGILHIDQFSGEELVRFYELVYDYGSKSNLSETDCSVMFLAERLNCRLLTADQKLRKQAESRGIQVNGFLWLTDEMVRHNVVSKAAMSNYLKLYLRTNARAPEEEVQKRIDEYFSDINVFDNE